MVRGGADRENKDQVKVSRLHPLSEEAGLEVSEPGNRGDQLGEGGQRKARGAQEQLRCRQHELEE